MSVQLEMVKDFGFVWVLLEKISWLMDFVGELLLSVFEIVYFLDLQGLELILFDVVVYCLIMIVCEVQDVVIELCFVLMDDVFKCLCCMVCELECQIKKKIDLVIEGGDIVIDKFVVDCFYDLLLYVVCNLVDYGFEIFDEWVEFGKDEKGCILLVVSQIGSEVCIIVEDDGWGLNCEKILKCVCECGFFGLDEELELVKLWCCIFEFGFLIVEVVSNLFGCGVGMDVLNSIMNVLCGWIIVDSEGGKGICVLLFIFVLLVFFDCIILWQGYILFVVLIDVVLEIVCLEENELMYILVDDNCEMLCLCGEMMLIICLDEFFNEVDEEQEKVLVLFNFVVFKIVYGLIFVFVDEVLDC